MKQWQRKRLNDLTTTNETDRLCVGCKHFHIFFGEEDWSEVTPGDSPSLSCRKGKFSQSGKEECNDTFRTVIRTARACESFEFRGETT